MASNDLSASNSRTYWAARRAVSLVQRITQPLLIDAENVPAEGPFMLIGNHTLLGVQDLPALVVGLERERGVLVRGLADRAHFELPLWRDLVTRFGAVLGTRENCLTLLEAGEAVLDYPGGAGEVFKRRGQQYQLLWGERTGFASVAIQAGCPIIPFGGVGAEDRFKVVVDVDDQLGRPAGAIARHVGRADIASVLVGGAGPALLPRPERFYFRFGKPIDTKQWAGRYDDEEALGECRDITRTAVEEQLDYLLKYREDDPERSFTRRAVGALRRII